MGVGDYLFPRRWHWPRLASRLLRLVGRALYPLASALTIPAGYIIIHAISPNQHSSIPACDMNSIIEMSARCLRLPAEFWQLVAFIALCASVFSAFILYFRFPVSYKFLELSDLTAPIVLTVIPTYQVMCVLVSALNVGSSYMHLKATIAYMALFVAWDLLILGTPVDPGSASEGNKFKGRVLNYLLIDAPCTSALIILYYLTFTSDPHDFEVFFAGILAMQSIFALISALTEYWNEYLGSLPKEIANHFLEHKRSVEVKQPSPSEEKT